MMTDEGKLPGYLQDAPQTGHVYGTLSYNRRSKCWTIKGEPCVTEMATRLFPGSERRRGQARFTANRRMIGDVNWLMMRYPLEIAPRDRELWKNALAQARELGSELVTLCSACHHVIKRVNGDMKNDAVMAARVQNYLGLETPYTGETTVLHYLEVLQ